MGWPFYVAVRRNPVCTLRWRHNGHDGVSNHQPHQCLLNRLFGFRSKKTSKLRVTDLIAGNLPGTREFPAQMASDSGNVSIWWCHHECGYCDQGRWGQSVKFALPVMGTWFLMLQQMTDLANSFGSRILHILCTPLHIWQRFPEAGCDRCFYIRRWHCICYFLWKRQRIIPSW